MATVKGGPRQKRSLIFEVLTNFKSCRLEFEHSKLYSRELRQEFPVYSNETFGVRTPSGVPGAGTSASACNRVAPPNVNRCVAGLHL